MEKENKLGKYILDTAHHMKVTLDALFDDENLNGLQARILGFVEYSDHKGCDVYQKDIEAEFKIRRSSVSSVLDTMEKNGFIMRKSVDFDARLKKLVLTEKAKQVGQQHRNSVNLFENAVADGLTQQEIDTLKALLRKVSENIVNMRGEMYD